MLLLMIILALVPMSAEVELVVVQDTDGNALAGCTVSTGGRPWVELETGVFELVPISPVQAEQPLFAAECPGLLPKQVRLAELMASNDVPWTLTLVKEPTASVSDELLVVDTASSIGSEIDLEDTAFTAGASVSDNVSRFSGAVISSDGRRDLVLLRGLEPQLSVVRLNGERLPSNVGGERSADLASLPSQFFRSASVETEYSVRTDADAIAGVLDLRTSRSGPRKANLSVESFYDSLSGAMGGAVGVSLQTRSRTGQLAANISSVGAHRSALTTLEEDRYNSDQLVQQDLREQTLDRDSAGHTGNLSLFLSQSSTWSLRGLQQYERLDELRHRVKVDIAGSEVERETKESTVLERLNSIALSNMRQLGHRWTLSTRLSHLGLLVREPDRADASFVAEVDGHHFNTASTLDVFQLDKVGVEDNRADDQTRALALDFSRAGSRLQLRLGAKARDKKREQDTNSVLYEPGATLSLVEVLSESAHGPLDLGQLPASGVGRELVDSGALLGRRSLEEDAGDFFASEELAAAYLETEWSLGDSTHLTVGIRGERYDTRYEGKEVLTTDSPSDLEAIELARFVGQRTSTRWQPMLAIHREQNQWALRFSAARTASLPDYTDLVPFTLTDFEDLEIERGNPDLRHATAWNFDLSATRTLGRGTQVRLVAFQKSIKDYVYRELTTLEMAGEVFEVVQPTNAPDSDAWGVEMSLNHTVLGGPTRGLRLEGFFGRYFSETRLAGRQQTTRLPGQSSDVARIGMTWTGKQGALGLFGKTIGPSAQTIGTATADDLRLTRRNSVDLAAAIRISEVVQLKLDATGLIGSDTTVIDQAHRRHEFFDFGPTTRFSLHFSF